MNNMGKNADSKEKGGRGCHGKYEKLREKDGGVRRKRGRILGERGERDEPGE